MPKIESGPTPPAHAPKTLSRDDLVHLVGDLDDTALSAILETGASYVEVEEAVKAVIGNAEDLARLRRALSARAEAVYDILMTEPAFLPNGNNERGR